MGRRFKIEREQPVDGDHKRTPNGAAVLDCPPHNGAAVLEYGNDLPSFHEPPLGFAVWTTIPDKEEIDVFVQDSLISFMPDKNAEVV